MTIHKAKGLERPCVIVPLADWGMIAYGPYTEEVRVYCGWDAQRKCETILLCGLRSDGVAFWAKRIGNLV